MIRTPVWARVPLIRYLFRGNDQAATDVARRWRRSFADNPELAPDLIRMGGLLQMIPERVVDGQGQPDPIDPLRLAYEQGQRDFALRLLALGGISIYDLNQLMENNHDN